MSRSTETPATTYNKSKQLVEDYKNHAFCKQLDSYHYKRGRHGVARIASVAADIRRVLEESDFETIHEKDKLSFLFNWGASANGHDYWQARAGTTE